MNRENIIYHYTDAKSLIEIIKTRKLWATDIRFMNDKREGEIAVNHLKHIGQKLLRLEGIEITPFIAEVIEYFVNSSRHNYIASFSKRYDNLSLFRTYGPPDGAYCIGFDWEYLNDIPGVSCKFCEYSYETQTSDVALLFQKMIKDIEKGQHEGKSSLHTSNSLVQNPKYFNRLAELSVIHKSPEFFTEEEVRVVSHNWKERQVRVSSREHIIIPYVEIDLPNTETDVLITLGPNSDHQLAQHGFQEVGNLANISGTQWKLHFGPWDLSGYRTM